MVAEQRRLEIPISTNEIIYKLIELEQKQKDKQFHTLQKWCYGFLKRYSYGSRHTSHVGQQIIDSSKIDYENFFKILYIYRKELNELDDRINIFNMDETPIYLEMFSKTCVVKIRERSVNVKTFGSDRNRISLILCISANELKLPSLIIFKGQPNGRIESLLSKNDFVKNKKIYALCQPNSWADKNIFLLRLKNIFQ